MAIIAGIFGLPSTPAGAVPINSPYYSIDSEVICDATFNTMRAVITNPWVHASYRGMQVQVRTYVEATNLVTHHRSGQWSQWNAPVRIWGNWQVLTNAVVRSDMEMYRMYVEVRYWTGSRWSAASGNWATPYSTGVLSNGQRGKIYTGFCTT